MFVCPVRHCTAPQLFILVSDAFFLAPFCYLASLGIPLGRAPDDQGEGYKLAGLNLSTIIDDGPKAIDELFPVSYQDPKTGRQHWHERVEVVEAVAKELFDRCSQPPPIAKTGSDAAALMRAPVSEVQTSFRRLLGHPALSGGKCGLIDVDEVLWLFMRHWLVGAHQERIHTCSQSGGCNRQK